MFLSTHPPVVHARISKDEIVFVSVGQVMSFVRVSC